MKSTKKQYLFSNKQIEPSELGSGSRLLLTLSHSTHTALRPNCVKQEKRRSSLAQQRKAHHQPILAQHTVLHYTTTLVFFLPSHEPKRASFGTSASSAQRSSLMERQNFFITFLYYTHSATKCWSDQNFSKCYVVTRRQTLFGEFLM